MEHRINGQGDSMEVNGVEIPLDAQFPAGVGEYSLLLPHPEYIEDVLGGTDE